MFRSTAPDPSRTPVTSPTAGPMLAGCHAALVPRRSCCRSRRAAPDAASSSPRPRGGRSWRSPASSSPTHGYAGTSLDTIVAGAEVTKGALYHHFSGKQALFESVFESVENDATRDISRALRNSKDPWEKATAGLQRVPRGRPGPDVPADRDPGGSGGARLRALPRAGGALDVRPGPRHRPRRCCTLHRRASTRPCSPRSRGSSSAPCPRPGRASARPRTRPLAVARIETAIGFILAGLRTLTDTGARPVRPGPAATGPDQRPKVRLPPRVVAGQHLDPGVARGDLQRRLPAASLNVQSLVGPALDQVPSAPCRRGRPSPHRLPVVTDSGTKLPAGSV